MAAEVKNSDLVLSEEAATAPSFEHFDMPPGYQSDFIKGPLPPPAFGFVLDPNMEIARASLPTTDVQIDERDVRVALNNMVNKNCCYGKQFTKNFNIRDILMKNVLRYKLETFTEVRKVKWKAEPFKGGEIDSPAIAPPPAVWDVHVPLGEAFKEDKKKTEIPHTSTVKPCHVCAGIGRVRCKHCDGFGGSTCTSCNGTGSTDDSTCNCCNGTGRKRCTPCAGHGQVRCSTCKGFCQMRCYLKLIVNWKVHTDNYVSDESSLDKKLTCNVNGVCVIDERYPRLNPLSNFADDRIVSASNGLLQKHLTAFQNEKIIEQRHNVSIIPIAIVQYEHKQKEGNFTVYGLEHEVLFEDYPYQCCCGCVLL